MSEPLNPNPVPGSAEERQELEAMLRARGETISPELLDAIMAGRAAQSPAERDVAVKNATNAVTAPVRAVEDEILTPGPIRTFYTRKHAFSAMLLTAIVEVYLLMAWILVRNVPWWLGALVTALTVAQVFVVVRLSRQLSGGPASRRHTLLLQLLTIVIPVVQIAAIFLTAKYVQHLI